MKKIRAFIPYISPPSRSYQPQSRPVMTAPRSRLSATFTAFTLLMAVLTFFALPPAADAFQSSPSAFAQHPTAPLTRLRMAQVSEAEAKVGIDKVVAALRKNREANSELGKLATVNNVLGYGSPKPGTLAVRFNASFRKGGFGLTSKPLPFMLGQSNDGDGRGEMVGQVKASLDSKSGKILECSVFRDVGYGRAFNMKI